MRTDFQGSFYEIEVQLEAGRWGLANFDHFGTPEGFTASDHCWQKIGHHGTFDEKRGRKGIATLSAKWPKQNFRLVRRDVSWKTSTVVTLLGAGQ